MFLTKIKTLHAQSLWTALLLSTCLPYNAYAQSSVQRPNFVVIFCDDLGWGDLTCYGHPTIATPYLDEMARQGTRLTQFYVAASVCTPSRAGLITGRYPVRCGMYGNRRVLFPDSVGGLQDTELTVAEVLKSTGYATGMVGKWHLGHLPKYLPTEHGFDVYHGIPYSNDMDKIKTPSKKGRAVFDNPDYRDFNVPLLHSLAGKPPTQIERPAVQDTITRRYTEWATEFIQDHREQPFFLYLAHSLPHVPLFRDQPFVDHSRAGLYGDVIEEIDWSVGQILQTIRDSGLDDRTMVIFTSDNGPWLSFGDQGGSAGPLRDGKGTTFEGGMRVPGIVWMPGRVAAGKTSAELASTLDFLPTLAAMAGATLPDDVVLDGYDLSGTWLDGQPSPRQSMFYYRGEKLMAIRSGRYKAHFATQTSYRKDGNPLHEHDQPLLYDLETDIGEQRDLANRLPAVLAEITKLKTQHQAAMVIAPSQLDRKD